MGFVQEARRVALRKCFGRPLLHLFDSVDWVLYLSVAVRGAVHRRRILLGCFRSLGRLLQQRESLMSASTARLLASVLRVPRQRILGRAGLHGREVLGPRLGRDNFVIDELYRSHPVLVRGGGLAAEVARASA